MSTLRLRELLVRAFGEARASLDLGALVRAGLPATPRASGRVTLVAVGKGAPAMAAAALDHWPARFDAALVVTTDGTDAASVAGRAEVERAGHPVPDRRSERAALRALALAPRCPGDLLLVLISGGASALLEAPPPGLDLAAVAGLARDLVLSGATIQDINCVRRHLSRIKGGRLALAAAPGRTLTLYASDVPNGAPEDVGSGPSVADPTTVADAEAALERALGRGRAAALSPFLTPSLDPRSPEAALLEVHAVATPRTLAEAVAARLRAAGLTADVLPEATRPAADLVRDYARLAHELSPGEALVAPCEPVLRVAPAAGRGGRAGWLALALLDALPEGVAFLAGASDGVDGSSGAAGACVAADVPHDPAQVASALARFDDATLHAALGTAIPGGPTGLNLTDVHVLARA